MTRAERRKRPEHHVVHDYANLVSSGLLITEPDWRERLSALDPAISHIWHAFYMNCRKMFEFFTYTPKPDYLRASRFVTGSVTFDFAHWTLSGIHQHMHIHLLHVGGDRTTREIEWDGKDDRLYLDDFQRAWQTFLQNLKHEHRDIFRDEIDDRLESEFRHCGTLGREFIPMTN